ncbi:MAG: dockerin type I domain-containing protein [Phycisphaerales bacterium]|nr:dockerin type I domain-containing protein [Phycisphaerales bacterium]
MRHHLPRVGVAVFVSASLGLAPAPKPVTSTLPELSASTPESTGVRTSCTTPCIPAPEGLIAWWPFDEATGSAAYNELIHDNDGIPIGNVTTAPGHVGNGAKFEPGFSAIEAPHIDPLDFNIDEDFSLVTWLYVPSGTDVLPLIDKRTSEGDVELGWLFGCSSGQLLLKAIDADGASHTWITPSVIPDDEWVHVAVTVDRSSPTGVEFYVNGWPVSQGDATLVPGKIASGNSVRIGASHRLDGFSSLPSMRGGLDEVQIYHRSLFNDEMLALAYADCGGTCKVRMHVTKVTPFCDGEFFSEAIVTIDNATDFDRSFDLTAVGLSGDQNSDYCVQNGPASIQIGISNPISVPAGQSIEIPLVIDRPGGLLEDGDSACWRATIEDLDTGMTMQRKGIVSAVRDICISGDTNGVIPMLVDQPIPVKFTLTNDTATDYHSYWKIAAVESTTGLLNRVMKLNNEEPGAELYGYTFVPPNSSVNVIVDVTYLRQREGDKEESKYSDVTFYEDPGTDVPWESSDSVGSEPVEEPIDDEAGCGADTNCDGVVDVSDLLAVIAAWGDCPEGDPCTADTNGDGTVNVTDLLAIIASWG